MQGGTDQTIGIEEKILAQKCKINWPKLGDGNNAFFHAAVREKNKGTTIFKLVWENGNIITDQNDLEEEVL